DVLLNKIPLIFQKEIYATACIFGGVLYFILLNTPVPNIPSDLVCIAAVVVVRLLAVRNNWSLPDIARPKE
ncbi:MAG: trimeric intracellular cation channel family protein, partial [Chitinophagaceae bacterium]